MKTTAPVSHQFVRVILLLAALAGGQNAAWATLTWDPSTGSGTSPNRDGTGTWGTTTPANWWNGGSDVNYLNTTPFSDVIFGNGGAGGTVTLGAALSVNTFTFNSFSSTYIFDAASALTFTLKGSTLTMNSGAGAVTFNANAKIAFSVDATFDNESTANALTISSIISGNFNLTKTGPGALTLNNGPNNFGVGKTFWLKGGTLNFGTGGNVGKTIGSTTTTFKIDDGTTIDNLGGASVTMGNNPPITIAGNFTFTGAANNTHDINTGTGNVDLAGGTRTITTSGSGGTLTINGIVSNGGISKAGAGILALTKANTFSGGLNVLNGTVVGSIANSFGTGTISLGDNSGANSATLLTPLNGTQTNDITVAAGSSGTLTIAGSTANGATFSGSLALNNNLTITNGNNGKTVTFSGTTTETSSDSPALTVAILQSGAMAFSGGVVVGSGGLTFAGNSTSTSGQILTLGPGNITSTTTGSLTFNANNSGYFTVSAASINNAGAITNSGAGSGATTISGNIGGNVTRVVQNSTTSALTLSGTNTYTGPTIINAGTLALGVNGSISNSTSISIAAGATNDVSAITTYNLSSSTVLKASGTGSTAGTAAVIKGGATVNLNSQPIILTIAPTSTADTTHPALLLSSGALTLNNNAFTITNNSGSPLAVGTYRVIQVGDGSSGIINEAGSPSYAVNVYLPSGASGLISGATAAIAVSSGNVELTVTSGISIVPTTTALVSSANPSTYGSSVTFTATVQTNSPTGNAIGANSNFVCYVDGVAVATNLASGSTATFTINTLTAGNHAIQAVYHGDATYGPSTNSLIQTNNVRAVVLTGERAYDGTASATNAILTISNLISPDSFGVSGSADLVSANVGTNLITSTNLLTLPVTGAATNYTLVGASGAVVITNAVSNIKLVSSSQTNGYLSSLNFTSTVPSFVNSGSVIFLTNNSAFSTNGITNGVAYSLVLTNLTRGTNTITAEYAGDVNVLGSTNIIDQVVTNHPPVVSNQLLEARSLKMAWKIRLSLLATNWTDADGDALTLTAPAQNEVYTSTNGVAVTNNGVFLLYRYTTNSPDVNDRFFYTINDGYGGTNTGFVDVIVNPFTMTGQSLGLTNPATPTLTFYGVKGFSYSVERSTNVTFSPVEVLWQTNLIQSGPFIYTDPAPPQPQAFYRLTSP